MHTILLCQVRAGDVVQLYNQPDAYRVASVVRASVPANATEEQLESEYSLSLTHVSTGRTTTLQGPSDLQVTRAS